jgi:type IV secretion system protein VirB8
MAKVAQLMKSKLDQSTRVGSKKEEQDYYRDAKSWNREKYQLATKRARMWQWIAAGFGSVAVIACVTLLMLVPLKTAVPYVIRVDQTTGIVDIIQPLKAGAITQDEALTKYWIVQYLNAREQYDLQRFRADSYRVSKMSSAKVFDRYSDEFEPGRPNSPYNLYGSEGTIDIHIRSIVFLDKDTALVRFKRTLRDQGKVTESYWSVTLSFQYLLSPEKESDRFINPLGFQVISYRIDPEVIEEFEK